MNVAIRLVTGASIVGLVSIGSACRGSTTSMSGDPLARGKQVVQRMSDALSPAQALSVTTHEVRDAVQDGGKVARLTLDHKVIVRRPDRLYMETSGDRRNE